MKKLIVTALLMFSFLDANAHGTNKLGPHGGYIRMPGAYHVELVEKDNQTQVYFLDMHFKALEAKDASLSLSLKGSKDVAVACVNKGSFFECDTNLKEAKDYNSVELKSSLKKNGKLATSHYPLPLKLE